MSWRLSALLLVQLAVSLAAEDKEKKFQYRLPSSVQPTHYELRLKPYFDPALDGDDFGTFDGQALIRVEVQEPTSELRLHTLDMLINGFKVRDIVTRKTMNLTSLVVEEETQQVVAKLNTSLEKGRQYMLVITYKGHLRDDHRGIARAFYKDADTNEIRWVVFASFEPTHARRAFPCWDEPGFKSRFTVRIARRRHNTAVSTMPLNNTVPDYNGVDWVWDSFTETPLLPPYLLSMTVGPWVSVNASASSSAAPGAVPGSCYVVPGQESRVREAAAVIGSALHVAADSVIGVGLPPGISKLDCVVVPEPNMDWAVENWGLLTFGESMAMVEEDYTDAASLEEVWTTASHEVAHLWFGNLATPRWWSNLWLKEGFATYFQYAIVDHMRPEWQMWSRFAVDVTQWALREDMKGQRTALYADVVTPADIEDRYDEVSYHKGGAFIRMLESFTGKDLLLNGLRKFLLERFTDQSGVDLDDLFRALGDVSDRLPPGKTVADVMTPWVTQAGFPLVTVSRLNDSFLTLSQSQFQPENVSATPDRWWIPVTYTCSPLGGSEQLVEGLVWLPPDSDAVVPIDRNKCKWLIFNMGHKGYYRVNYARNLQQWRRLSMVLAQDVEAVPADGRAQLLDDAFSLAAAELLDYRAAFGLATSFLERETAPGPWSVATNYFSEILLHLRYKPGISQLFTNFLKRLVRRPLLQSLEAGHREHSSRLLKNLLSSWACSRLDLCPDSYAERLSSEDRTEVLTMATSDPDLVGAAMCALQRASTSVPEVVQKALSRNAAPPLRVQAISAIACSTSTAVIYSFLKISLDPEASNTSTINIARAMDTVLTYPSHAAFNAAHALVLEFMNENTDTVPLFLALLLNLAGTKNETDLALSLAKNYQNETAIMDSLEQLEADQQWLLKFARVIYQWLQSRREKAPTRSSSGRVRGQRRGAQISRQKSVGRKARVPRMATGDSLDDELLDAFDDSWEQNVLETGSDTNGTPEILQDLYNAMFDYKGRGLTEKEDATAPEGRFQVSELSLQKEYSTSRISQNSVDGMHNGEFDSAKDCRSMKATAKRGERRQRRPRRHSLPLGMRQSLRHNIAHGWLPPAASSVA